MKLLWGRAAQQDVARITSFYNQIRPGLGDDLKLKIETACLPLLDFPNLGRPTSRRGVLKWNARHTPYQLLYAVVGDAVQVRRVRHNRMDD